MNRCEKIRTFLKSQATGQRAGEIAIGIGMPGDVRVSYALAQMYRDGYINRDGTGKQMTYTFARDPKPRPTPEEARANRKAYERKRATAKSQQFRLRKQSKPVELKADKPKAALPPRKAIQLAVNTVKARSAAVAIEKKEAAVAPPRGQAETVDQFIARGGEVQVLHPWDTSKPLRLLGERFIELD